MSPKIEKSSRHSKITGDFAEHLILYLLSKYGFESVRVDHTGIDLIARNPKNDILMGISVKSRSRTETRTGEYVSIPNENFAKSEAACRAFGCTPYFAIVVDEDNKFKIFILSMEHLRKINVVGTRIVAWKMTEKWIAQYENDPNIVKIEFDYRSSGW